MRRSAALHLPDGCCRRGLSRRGQTQPGRSAQPGFAWLNPAPAPAGWPTVPIPSGAAVSYPPGWSRIHGDPGTATVVLLGSGHQILGYLNVTPRQGPETLANFAHFRVDHNGDEGDHGITTLAATTKRRFGKNPFTGLEQWFEAKPATVRVKVRALKKVKDAAVNG